MASSLPLLRQLDPCGFAGTLAWHPSAFRYDDERDIEETKLSGRRAGGRGRGKGGVIRDSAGRPKA
jgi:hypothetical protein